MQVRNWSVPFARDYTAMRRICALIYGNVTRALEYPVRSVLGRSPETTPSDGILRENTETRPVRGTSGRRIIRSWIACRSNNNDFGVVIVLIVAVAINLRVVSESTTPWPPLASAIREAEREQGRQKRKKRELLTDRTNEMREVGIFVFPSSSANAVPVPPLWRILRALLESSPYKKR